MTNRWKECFRGTVMITSTRVHKAKFIKILHWNINSFYLIFNLSEHKLKIYTRKKSYHKS
jgi:hypothetical protein